MHLTTLPNILWTMFEKKPYSRNYMQKHFVFVSHCKPFMEEGHRGAKAVEILRYVRVILTRFTVQVVHLTTS